MLLGKEFYLKALTGDEDRIYPTLVGHLIGIMSTHDIEAKFESKDKETLQDIQNLLDAFHDIKKDSHKGAAQENTLPDYTSIDEIVAREA